MYIENITLKNYRSYKEASFKFSPNLNIIIGKNAQGKTNILEAIFYAIIGKSFRTYKDNEVINCNCQNAFIKAKFKKKI